MNRRDFILGLLGVTGAAAIGAPSVEASSVTERTVLGATTGGTSFSTGKIIRNLLPKNSTVVLDYIERCVEAYKQREYKVPGEDFDSLVNLQYDKHGVGTRWNIPVYPTVNPVVEYIQRQDSKFVDRCAPIRTIASWVPVEVYLECLTSMQKKNLATKLVNQIQDHELVQILFGDGMSPNIDGLATGTPFVDKKGKNPYVAAYHSFEDYAGQTPNLFYLPFSYLKSLSKEKRNLLYDMRNLGIKVKLGRKMPEGVGVLGLSHAAGIWDRGQSTIRMMDVHGDHPTPPHTVFLLEERFTVAKFDSRGFMRMELP